MTRQQLADDMRRNIQDNPTSFEFDGTIYTGEYSGLSESKRLEIGGFDVEPIGTIVINLVDQYGNPTFQERPRSGDLVTVDQRQLRIIRTELDSTESAIQLDLGSDAK